jgi:nitroimidazol reductase NimA-like FMN-containing flavoprotein (pyridoxamine 5'-phosphate oxidase superfamily)
MNVEPLLEVQRRSYAGATSGLRSAWPESAALDGRRMAALLERHRYCVLATGRTDGRPHASPVAFVVAGGAFWIATVEGLRLRNLRARPWASVVVMEGDADEGERGDAHRALTAEGPVTLHEVAAAYGRLETEWLRRHEHAPEWAAAFGEVRPERIFSHAVD